MVGLVRGEKSVSGDIDMITLIKLVDQSHIDGQQYVLFHHCPRRTHHSYPCRHCSSSRVLDQRVRCQAQSHQQNSNENSRDPPISLRPNLAALKTCSPHLFAYSVSTEADAQFVPRNTSRASEMHAKVGLRVN